MEPSIWNSVRGSCGPAAVSRVDGAYVVSGRILFYAQQRFSPNHAEPVVMSNQRTIEHTIETDFDFCETCGHSRRLGARYWRGRGMEVTLLVLGAFAIAYSLYRNSPLITVQAGATMLAGAVAANVARRLAGNQLAPRLLERFNGTEMYAARRDAYRDEFLWWAGDRSLLIQYQAADTFLVSDALKAANLDVHLGVSRLYGFIIELHEYYHRGIIDRAALIVLFRDRFSWFVRFLTEFARELERSYDCLVDEKKDDPTRRVPFPFVYAPHVVDWLVRTLDLQAFVRMPLRVAREDQRHLFDVTPTERWSEIQGLLKRDDLATYRLLLDLNHGLPDSLLARRRVAFTEGEQEYDVHGRRGFLRLRARVASDHVQAVPRDKDFMLDVGYPTPYGFYRRVDYLNHDDARSWYQRMLSQGAVEKSPDHFIRPGGPA
jgi:hypothetical protein